MKTKEEIKNGIALNHGYITWDVMLNSINESGMSTIIMDNIFDEYAKLYHDQFKQPIYDEEIEKEIFTERHKVLKGHGNMSTQRITLGEIEWERLCIRIAKWAIERMGRDDRELLVKFASRNDKYNIGSKVKVVDHPKRLKEMRKEWESDVDEFLKQQ